MARSVCWDSDGDDDKEDSPSFIPVGDELPFMALRCPPPDSANESAWQSFFDPTDSCKSGSMAQNCRGLCASACFANSVTETNDQVKISPKSSSFSSRLTRLAPRRPWGLSWKSFALSPPSNCKWRASFCCCVFIELALTLLTHHALHAVCHFLAQDREGRESAILARAGGRAIFICEGKPSKVQPKEKETGRQRVRAVLGPTTDSG